ncbi:MAG: Ig-like domain-containing protein, partial [Propionivibrio sp.]
NPPVAANDSYTAIAHPASSGITQVVAAPGVLANDYDPDGNALHTGSKTGSTRVTLNANGGFALAPAGNGGGSTGTLIFGYRALDTSNAPSAAASATISVIANRRPTSVADSLTVPRCTVRVGTTSNCQTTGVGAYVPLTFNLTNNDTDADTATIDAANQLPLSVARVRSGTSGNGSTSGTLTTGSLALVRFTGTAATGIQVTYTPRYNFAGVDTFQYKVMDRLGLTAGNTNAQGWVTVTVTVQ